MYLGRGGGKEQKMGKECKMSLAVALYRSIMWPINRAFLMHRVSSRAAAILDVSQAGREDFKMCCISHRIGVYNTNNTL